MHLRPRSSELEVIDLPHGAVYAIDEVFVDTNWRSNPTTSHGAGTLVADTAYVLDRQRRELWYPTGWVNDPRANLVNFQAGVTSTPMPFDIVWMVQAGVKHLLDMPRYGSVAAVSQGGQSLTRADAEAFLPAPVRNALGPYRVWGALVG